MQTTHDQPQETSGTVDVASIIEPCRAMVRVLAPALENLSDQVWCFGLAEPPARKALALVAQMAAELITGTEMLFEHSRKYAGASLLRQLIETEYMLFLFSRDREEAERWVNSSESEQQKWFSPAAMRKRANNEFDVKEYSLHCAMGGTHERWDLHLLIAGISQRRMPLRCSGLTSQCTRRVCGIATKRP